MDDLFRQAREIHVERPKTVREHLVRFQGCEVGVFANVEPSGVCVSYTLRINDPGENTAYVFMFAEEIKNDLLKTLTELPAIGEKVDEQSD